MCKKIPFLLCLMLLATVCFSQETKAKDDPELAGMTPRELRFYKKMKVSGQYPVIKSHVLTGVIPVKDIDAFPDTNQLYKIIVSWTVGGRDSGKLKKVNSGLSEIGRILNLHVTAGIPKKNIEMVVAVHGAAIFSVLNEEAFHKMFHMKNPNAALLKELQDAGVKFIACGQAMGFLEVPKQSLSADIKLALTANVILSSYQRQGFVLFNEDVEN